MPQTKTPARSRGCSLQEKGSGLSLRNHPIHFLQTGGLAAQSANVEQLGATYFIAANLFDLVHNLGVERENALHALPKAHLANGKGALRPTVDGDHEALKRLQTFLIAFF